MAHRIGPPAKKALDYERSRRLLAEDPHRFRRAWPKKKQLRNQHYRKLLKRALEDELTRADRPIEDVAPAVPFRRKSQRTYGADVPLGQAVRGTLRSRAYRMGWNLTKHPYEPERDRARAIAFVEALTEGRTARLREVALYWQAALEAPPDFAWPWHGVISTWHPGERFHAGRAAWLQAFLADQPAWRGRLQAWIEVVLALPPIGPARSRRPGA